MFATGAELCVLTCNTRCTLRDWVVSLRVTRCGGGGSPPSGSVAHHRQQGVACRNSERSGRDSAHRSAMVGMRGNQQK